MSSAFEVRVRKFLSTIEKTAANWLKKYQNDDQEPGNKLNNESNDVLSRVNTYSLWDSLPVELQITVFGRCRLQDMGNLRLVSRAFRDLIDIHEHAIAREYLRIRRHGSLPVPLAVNNSSSPSASDPTHWQQKRHTRAPQDDVILLSDLFPPQPPPSGRVRDAYTFRYLSSLRRRQKECSRLAYYLADRVLDKYMQSDPSIKASFASKRDRQAFYERGIAILQFKLTPLMYYTLFFLESYSNARRGLQDTLYAAYEAGQLPVPVQPVDRAAFYRQLQAKILQNPPFTDTPTLLSTHHCINLLVCYLRLTLAPDPPFYSSSDSLISMLLSASGLTRLVEYFAAEKGGGTNQRAMRKEFMRNMQADWDASRNDPKALKVYGNSEESTKPSPLREIWFESARSELRARGALPHRTEDWVIIWEGAKISIGCQHCEGEDGWQA
ncbi:hypothetical protein VTO42DRAFT_5222 [Malbranchea cinnamomea]